MKIIMQLLMLASAISLLLAVLMGFNIIAGDILNVSGRGFLELSIACVLYAIGLKVVQPLGGEGGGAE